MDTDDVIVKSEKPKLFRATELAFDRSTQEVVGLMKEDAPVSVTRGVGLNAGDVQGGLRGSLTATPVQRTAFGLSRFVGSALRYAAQREFGGTISPTRAPRLAWRDPVTGRLIVLPKGRSVRQLPGGKRQGNRPYIRPNVEKWPALMDEHLRSIKI